MIKEQKLCALFGVTVICVLSEICFSQPPANVSPDKPAAVKLLEVGKVSNRTFIRALDDRKHELTDCRFQLYIINYGEKPEIARREKIFSDWLSTVRRSIDCSRITLIRGDTGESRTVFWKIPPGADNPAP